MRFLVVIILFSISLVNVYSQDAKEHIRKGNELYKNKKFNDAEIAYRKASELEPKMYESIFNLGDALYKQGNYKNASTEFLNIINKTKDKNIKAKAYHNLGNSLLKSNKIQESIDAYKNSLKLNPNDLDAKYNLEYAKKLLIKQKQQQKQNNKNQKQNQKQNQNKKNNQDKKNDNKNQKQNQKQQNQQQQKQQKQQQKISKKDAERILQALSNEEKKLNKKLKKQVVGSKRQPAKKW